MNPRVWRLIVAYDGAAFAGWQRQRNAVSAQGALEEAATRFLGCPVTLHGASRTDAGVHALGQVAHFEHPPHARDFSPEELRRAFNAHLPPELRVLKACRAAAGFHSRFDACGKRYRYRMTLGPASLPLEQGRAWHEARPLDLAAMREAARPLVGKHDFLPFSATPDTPRKPGASTVRTVFRLDIVKRSGGLDIVVEGDGFLFRMVRSLAGALVHVGLGKETPDWVREVLHSGKRTEGVVTAPACGLYLEQVYYRPRKAWKEFAA
jgi:tRNA pseudouridine38-40 synthase